MLPALSPRADAIRGGVQLDGRELCPASSSRTGIPDPAVGQVLEALPPGNEPVANRFRVCFVQPIARRRSSFGESRQARLGSRSGTQAVRANSGLNPDPRGAKRPNVWARGGSIANDGTWRSMLAWPLRRRLLDIPASRSFLLDVGSGAPHASYWCQ